DTVAYRLEAVDETRVLLLGEDQGVSLSLERWGRKISQISTLRCGYQGDIAFEPRRGRVLHGDEGISIPRMHAFRLQDQQIVRVEEMDVPDRHGPRPGGTWVLSSDGRDFYYGRLQFEAADLTNVRRVFDEPI